MDKAFLDGEAIIARAERNTELRGLVDASLHGRIMTLIAGINEPDGIPASSVEAAFRQICELLEGRLRFEHEWRSHPEIADEIIERPVFVVGFARTGTSAMQALLAQDSANRAVNWAQSCFPVPPQGWDAETDRKRDEAAGAILQDWINTVKTILTAHPYWDGGAEAFVENEELFALDFWWFYYTKLFKVPAVARIKGSFDSFAAFAFHKRLLQYWQWKQPRRRWVTKGVAHQFALDGLWATYPDAICIWTHRDPATMITSSMGTISMCEEAIVGGLDHAQFGQAFLAHTHASIKRMMAQPWADDPRVFHVRFDDFMNDQIGTIASIYEKSAISVTAEFKRKMRAWLDDPANRSDRHGKFGYKPEDFGLTREEVSEKFRDYTARFLEG